MGESPEELRQEIAQKRDDASQKIDEVERRVESPAQKARHTAETGANMVRRRLVDSARKVKEKVGRRS